MKKTEEGPIEVPQGAPPEEKPPSSNNGRLNFSRRDIQIGFAMATFFTMAVILTVVLVATLHDKKDGDSSSEDAAQAWWIRTTATTTMPESFQDEANSLNYMHYNNMATVTVTGSSGGDITGSGGNGSGRDSELFVADLTVALKEHVEYFIEHQKVPFQCWYPPCGNCTEVPGEAGGEHSVGGELTDYGTNVQEASVDEADIIKADRSFVYAAAQNHIVVWDRHGNQLTDLTLEDDGEDGNQYSQQVKALLLTESFLVAIADVRDDEYFYDFVLRDERPPPTSILYDYLATHILVYRREETGSLTLLTSKYIHGRYVDARSMMGKSIYIQTQSCVDVAAFLWEEIPKRGTDEEPTEYANAVTKLAEDLLIPNFVRNLMEELNATMTTPLNMMKFHSWSEGEEEDEERLPFLRQFTQITSFNAQDIYSNHNQEMVVSASGLIGQTSFPYLYASGDKLVLAGAKWDHWARRFWGRGHDTRLVALEVDSRSSRFLSWGTAKGWLLNSYALDILGNDLRVATTLDRTWVGWDEDEEVSRTANYMTVFKLEAEEDDDHVEGEMLQTGQVQIGKPNERIMSVRFFDNIAYAVTFEQTDPFYVLDMKEPIVLGELFLPGFSSYLHSMNDDNSLLVAVGTGADRGLVVTVFDSSDPTNPQAVVQHSFGGGSYSNVQWDYKAFRLIGGKLIIPMNQYSHEYGDSFRGFVVLSVSKSNISEDFRVSHLLSEDECLPCEVTRLGDPGRSLVYSGDLMTIKNGIVKSTDLENGEALWRLLISLDEVSGCWQGSVAGCRGEQKYHEHT